MSIREVSCAVGLFAMLAGQAQAETEVPRWMPAASVSRASSGSKARIGVGGALIGMGAASVIASVALGGVWLQHNEFFWCSETGGGWWQTPKCPDDPRNGLRNGAIGAAALAVASLGIGIPLFVTGSRDLKRSRKVYLTTSGAGLAIGGRF